jgi:hypothetical protein
VQLESDVFATGKVGQVGELVAGPSSSAGEEHIVSGSELVVEGKEKDCVAEEFEVEKTIREGDTFTGLVVENGGSGLLNQGPGEDMSCGVVEKIRVDLGNREGTTEEPEGEHDSFYQNISDPVLQLEHSQRIEPKLVGRKGAGGLGVEEASHVCIPRELEGLKEGSCAIIQSGLSSEIVEGGEGDDLEGMDPISVVPLAVEMDKDSSSNVSPRWVLERVKGYYKLVGVSCDQYEDTLLALYEQIEARRAHSLADSLAMVTTVAGVKGQREIRRLDCYINYYKKGEQSNRRRGKGRGLTCVNEA